SPLSMRFFKPPDVSLTTVTLLPVCFSKSGTRASTTCLNAPAVRTFNSAALAEPEARTQAKAAIKERQRKAGNMADSPVRTATYTIRTWFQHKPAPLSACVDLRRAVEA